MLSGRAERGSMLIEALVAVVIFGLGILGIIGAVGTQARAGQDARYRTEAAAAVDELVARIQTASPATRVKDFTTGGTGFQSWLVNRLQAAGSGLPNADATVTFGAVGADPRTVAVEVTWTAPREGIRSGTAAKTAQLVTHRFRTVLAILR